jgi:hypothetical protein
MKIYHIDIDTIFCHKNLPHRYRYTIDMPKKVRYLGTSIFSDIYRSCLVTVHRVWGRATGPHAQRVTLLVEDLAGEFCLLEPGPGQVAAAGWEDLLAGRLDPVVGARARVWGSLELGERHTGSNQARLFRVMRGVQPTHQRVLYSLAVAGGGLQLLGGPAPPAPDCPDLVSARTKDPGTRCSTLSKQLWWDHVL